MKYIYKLKQTILLFMNKKIPKQKQIFSPYEKHVNLFDDKKTLQNH